MELNTYKQIRKFLRTKGSKVAVEVGFTGYVIAEKSDYLKVIKEKESRGYTGPTNYDGEPEVAYTENNLLIVSYL